jgi:hypothetical protein
LAAPVPAGSRRYGPSWDSTRQRAHFRDEKSTRGGAIGGKLSCKNVQEAGKWEAKAAKTGKLAIDILPFVFVFIDISGSTFIFNIFWG